VDKGSYTKDNVLDVDAYAEAITYLKDYNKVTTDE
jgi:hypothetical protein